MAEQTVRTRCSKCKTRVLFENRPALYFCNYIFITAHKMYHFGFRIKDTVYFYLLSIIIIMILILKILLHNVYKIINLWYPTYVYQFLIFLIIPKIECWPVFKQEPAPKGYTNTHQSRFVWRNSSKGSLYER